MILKAVLPSTPGRLGVQGLQPHPAATTWKEPSKPLLSGIFASVHPHWCHFGKQGTELLLTFEGKRARTRQKEAMESVSCFVPVGISRTQDGAEISLLQSNGEAERGEARQNCWKLLVSPLGAQFGEFLSPCGRMRLSTECSAFAGLVSAGTSGHLNFDPNLAMYTSPKQDGLTPKKEA